MQRRHRLGSRCLLRSRGRLGASTLLLCCWLVSSAAILLYHPADSAAFGDADGNSANTITHSSCYAARASEGLVSLRMCYNQLLRQSVHPSTSAGRLSNRASLGLATLCPAPMVAGFGTGNRKWDTPFVVPTKDPVLGRVK